MSSADARRHWRAPAHVLVTGTSGAIGGALAREVRARAPRASLTLVDRDEEGSRRLADELRVPGGEAEALGCELGSMEATAGALAEAVRARGPVTGLVNCAGFMEVRHFETLPWERAEALLMVDLVSPLRLMHACVPSMAAAGRGFVVNVASMAGLVSLRGCAFYGAAKAGLGMASEIAGAELRPRGVDVVTLYPGAIRSALEDKARDQYGRGLASRLMPTGCPDELARLALSAVEAGRARVIYPRFYRVGALPLAGRLALRIGPPAVA